MKWRYPECESSTSPSVQHPATAIAILSPDDCCGIQDIWNKNQGADKILLFCS
jgi:hypothetical protein